MTSSARRASDAQLRIGAPLRNDSAMLDEI
jgi:hypothetical protein